jgi:hypothetical protein
MLKNNDRGMTAKNIIELFGIAFSWLLQLDGGQVAPR